jgi:hypothetical protein
MSSSRFEPETVTVPQRAAPADRGPRQSAGRDAAAETHAVREEDEDRGEEMADEPGYGHGV